jgi:hypothetical protein
MKQAQKFLFKCTNCEYKSTIKGEWMVITFYPNECHSTECFYSFLCVNCDSKKEAMLEI